MRSFHSPLGSAAMALLLLSSAAATAAPTEFTVTIREHRFEPAEVRIPANTKVKLIIDNQDATPEEFESKELNREKVVQGRSKGSVYVGPLKPGRYTFFGEYHEQTARGALVAE